MMSQLQFGAFGAFDESSSDLRVDPASYRIARLLAGTSLVCFAQPTPTDVHVDAALSDFSIAYIQEADNFVAGRALPVKPVEHKSDKYFIFNKNDWLRDDAVKQRAAGEAAPRSGFALSKGSYDAEAWWTEAPMSDLVLANADPSLPIDQALTRLVTQRCLIRRERQFASTFMTTGVWATDVVGGTDFTQWSDYASDPQKNIDDGKKKVLSQTGFEPNKLVAGYGVHQALKRHPLIKDQIKYTSDESITAAIIAKFLELEDYLVMRAIYASSEEGQTAAYAGVDFTDALLMYSKDEPGIMMPVAATIFAWSKLTAFNASGVAIDQYYDVKTKEDVVRGQFAHAMEVTGPDLGYFFSGATPS